MNDQSFLKQVQSHTKSITDMLGWVKKSGYSGKGVFNYELGQLIEVDQDWNDLERDICKCHIPDTTNVMDDSEVLREIDFFISNKLTGKSIFKFSGGHVKCINHQVEFYNHHNRSHHEILKEYTANSENDKHKFNGELILVVDNGSVSKYIESYCIGIFEDTRQICSRCEAFATTFRSLKDGFTGIVKIPIIAGSVGNVKYSISFKPEIDI